MDTRNSRFHQGFAWKVWEVESFGFKKCSWNFLGLLLTLQEVGKLPTLVYFSSRSPFWSYLSPRGYLVELLNANNEFFGILG